MQEGQSLLDLINQRIASDIDNDDEKTASDSILDKLNKVAAELESVLEEETEHNTTHTNTERETDDTENCDECDKNPLGKFAFDVLMHHIEKQAAGVAEAAEEAGKLKNFFKRITGQIQAHPAAWGAGLLGGGAALGAGAGLGGAALYYQKKIPEMQTQAYIAGIRSPIVQQALQRAYTLGRQSALKGKGRKKKR